MKRAFFGAIATLLAIGTTATSRGLGVTPVTSLPRGPVVDWSLEAQRAIVPPPAGEGNKFPGEAAVYMGIVHVAMYDAAVAIQGGYRPYAVSSQLRRRHLACGRDRSSRTRRTRRIATSAA